MEAGVKKDVTHLLMDESGGGDEPERRNPGMGGDESSLLLMDSDRSSKISLTSSPVDLHPTTKSKFHHNTPSAAGLAAVIHLLHPSMDHQRH